MTINVFPDYKEMSSATSTFIAKSVTQRPKSLLCFASGSTPTGTLSELVEMVNEKKINFSRCNFVGLDEWVGMDKDDDGSCQQYVYSHFFDPAQIEPRQITFFNAKADNLKEECKKVDDFIFAQGGIDLVLVGVGLNGHIGLNEPGTSPSLYCHVVDLEESTKKSAQKYFSQPRILDKGITLGVQHILNAKTVVVIANDVKKAEIIQKIIEGEVTPSVPGSILQRHPNCHFFLDKQAASKLSTT
jgi:glucosamine-6-phosphate isomerase